MVHSAKKEKYSPLNRIVRASWASLEEVDRPPPYSTIIMSVMSGRRWHDFRAVLLHPMFCNADRDCSRLCQVQIPLCFPTVGNCPVSEAYNRLLPASVVPNSTLSCYLTDWLQLDLIRILVDQASLRRKHFGCMAYRSNGKSVCRLPY